MPDSTDRIPAIKQRKYTKKRQCDDNWDDNWDDKNN